MSAHRRHSRLANSIARMAGADQHLHAVGVSVLLSAFDDCCIKLADEVFVTAWLGLAANLRSSDTHALQALAKYIRPRVAEWCRDIDPTGTVTLCDGRYLIFPGCEGFYDLRCEETLIELPRATAIYHVVDLGVIYSHVVDSHKDQAHGRASECAEVARDSNRSLSL